MCHANLKILCVFLKIFNCIMRFKVVLTKCVRFHGVNVYMYSYFVCIMFIDIEVIWREVQVGLKCLSHSALTIFASNPLHPNARQEL